MDCEPAAANGAQVSRSGLTRDCQPTAPWTVDFEPNPAHSDAYANAYTLRWNGLVRGQLYGMEQSALICAQLNIGNVSGVEVRS